jgi:two-component system chemotaxis response regulator CheB
VDGVISVQEIAAWIKRLAKEPSAEQTMDSEAAKTAEIEATIAEVGATEHEEIQRRGVPSAFACPDCHGVLWELREGDLVRYRCRVGHAYLPQALSAAQSNRLEESLWVALRTLKENRALSERLAVRARERRMLQVASVYEERAIEAAQRAAVIEDVLKRGHLSASGREPISADARPVIPDGNA